MKPVRLQLSRKKGFRLEALSRATNGLECVVVNRSSKKWGNPYKVEREPGCKILIGRKWQPEWRVRALHFPPGRDIVFRGERKHAIAYAVRQHRIIARARRKEIVAELAGKNLACNCGLDQSCHADVLLDLADPAPSDTTRTR